MDDLEHRREMRRQKREELWRQAERHPEREFCSRALEEEMKGKPEEDSDNYQD